MMCRHVVDQTSIERMGWTLDKTHKLARSVYIGRHAANLLLVLVQRCLATVLGIRISVHFLTVGFAACLALSGAEGAFAQKGRDAVPAGEEVPNPSRTTSGQENASTRGSETEAPQAWTALDRRINALWGEYLEARETSVERWLTVIGLVLTFFGIVVAILGLWAFRRFEVIEEKALRSKHDAERHAKRAGELLDEIKEQARTGRRLVGQMTAEFAKENPQQATELLAALREDPKTSAIEKVMASAISLQRSGKGDEAIELWRSISRIGEGANDRVLIIRAQYSIAFLLMDSDPEAAIDGFGTVIKLDPLYLKAYNNRGVVETRLGRHEKAIRDYNEAIRLDSELAEAYANRANSYFQLGLNDEALTDCNQAIRLKPDLAEAFLNRGNVYHSLEDYREALRNYSDAINLDPNSFRAFNNRADARVKLGSYEEALADCNQAIRLKPDFAEAFLNRADARVKLGSYEEAIADCNRAIGLNPKLPKAEGILREANLKLVGPDGGGDCDC